MCYVTIKNNNTNNYYDNDNTIMFIHKQYYLLSMIRLNYNNRDAQ